MKKKNHSLQIVILRKKLTGLPWRKVLRNMTQRVTKMMKKVMKQMRSGQYFLMILASLTRNSRNIFCVDCFKIYILSSHTKIVYSSSHDGSGSRQLKNKTGLSYHHSVKSLAAVYLNCQRGCSFARMTAFLPVVLALFPSSVSYNW